MCIACFIENCLQVFDDTPAGKDGTLESGDEIVGVNNKNVKGGNKTDVAHLIQASEVHQPLISSTLTLLFH